MAKNKGCTVTGITISNQQVKMATSLSFQEAGIGERMIQMDQYIPLTTISPTSPTNSPESFKDKISGQVRFIELDAEKISSAFPNTIQVEQHDCVWISEALSHLPNKKLFFENAVSLLKQWGKLVVADWFKAESLTTSQIEADIKPIEGTTNLIPTPVTEIILTPHKQMECSSHNYIHKQNTYN